MKEFKRSLKKIIMVGAPIATAFIYALIKGKASRIPANSISKVANNVASGLANNPEKVFCGLTQSTLDDLAQNTYRGIKAVIEGDTVKYLYGSNSGKSIISALIKFDEKGKLVVYLGNGPSFAAKSPRFFFEKVLEKIQEIK